MSPEGLLWAVGVDPERAYAAVPGALLAAGDRAARSGVLRAAGVAAHELGRLDAGIGHLRAALAAAPEPYTAARARMTLVGLLAARGDLPGALRAAERAAGVLRGADADRLAANVACALVRAGRLDAARGLAAGAIPRLGGDPPALAGLLTNLGLADAVRGDAPAAERALRAAVKVADEAGLTHQAAMARGNLAYVMTRRGDVPAALELYAAAEPRLRGGRAAQCRLDRAETLIVAGLAGEARPLLEETLAEVTARGYGCDVADGLLLLAHAELADGAPERAARTAELARTAFAGQRRDGWTPLAEHVLLRARWAAGDRSPVFLRSAAAAAERLAAAGWAEAAAGARIIAARVALALGRPAGGLLAGACGVRRGPAELRAAAWHATALDRLARDDPRGAVAAVWAGLRVAEEHVEVLGALELRARSAELGAELADLGLWLSRSARELLEVEERRRALARRPASARPPRDPARAAALAGLRAAGAARARAIAEGRPDPALEARVVGLEAAVRDGARRCKGPGGSPGGRPRPAELRAALAGRALVEYVRIGAELHAVTLTAARCRRRALGPYGPAVQETRLLRFALRTLAERAGDPHAPEALARAAGAAERRLLAPLAGDLGDRELVIAPHGALHGLPWAALPGLAGRPFAVVPSAAAWLHALGRPTGGRAVLVAGPGPADAGAEVAAVARLRPGAAVLRGDGARAAVVREALDGAGLAHVAAHGEFRADNPLFSHLRLADGPLMAYDLEELSAPPAVVVLSACDLGRAGDAVPGFAEVLLGLGARTVVASVAPVRDAAAASFMAALHGELARGRPPARALAAAPRDHGALGFLCFGAG